jgi:hypothetical protein
MRQLSLYGLSMMRQHIHKKRILEIADDRSRLSERELDHIEKCSECLALYAKSIIEVARERAKDKGRKPLTAPA